MGGGRGKRRRRRRRRRKRSRKKKIDREGVCFGLLFLLVIFGARGLSGAIRVCCIQYIYIVFLLGVHECDVLAGGRLVRDLVVLLAASNALLVREGQVDALAAEVHVFARHEHVRGDAVHADRALGRGGLRVRAGGCW